MNRVHQPGTLIVHGLNAGMSTAAGADGASRGPLQIIPTRTKAHPLHLSTSLVLPPAGAPPTDTAPRTRQPTALARANTYTEPGTQVDRLGLGCGVWSMVYCSWFLGEGFRVWDLGFMVWGSGCGVGPERKSSVSTPRRRRAMWHEIAQNCAAVPRWARI